MRILVASITLLCLHTVAALPPLRQRRTSSCLPLYALSPSLMDPIIQHPAVSELVINLRPRSRLKEEHKHLFANKNASNNNNKTLLFDELALVACSTGVVCRKELLETYAAAIFIHAKFPYMKRMADLAAGHGLLSWFLLALDYYDEDNIVTCIENSTEPRHHRTVVCVDRRMPSSADAIATAMINRFPELEGRWSYVQSDLSAIVPHPSCVLTSVHACGTLSDLLIQMAIATESPLAIVPCCHTVKEDTGYQPHVLSGMNVKEVIALVEARKKEQENAKHEAVADVVDEVRCRTLSNAGYDVEEVKLPEAFTARNRVLLGKPTSSDKLHDVAELKAQQFLQRQAKQRFARVPVMPPLIFVPLADNEESIAHCHAVGGRARVDKTMSFEKEPKHFSLHMALWLGGEEGSPNSSVNVTPEMLQEFANQCCGNQEIEEIQCTVRTFGEVNVQSITGRRSQLYKFKYSKPEGTNLSVSGASRVTAKMIHSALRERIVAEVGDVLR